LDATLKAIVDFIMKVRAEPPPDAVLDRCSEILADTLGCAIGGRDCIGAQVARTFPAAPSGEVGAVIGFPQGTSIDNAAFWNTAMIRTPDFTDSLSGGHPSDMLGALIAMSRPANASGVAVLTAMAIAYEIYSRISTTALARRPKTLDQGYAIALGAVGGICHLLGLDREQDDPRDLLRRNERSAAPREPVGRAFPLQGRRHRGLVPPCGVLRAHGPLGHDRASRPVRGRHGIVELMNGKEGPLNLSPFDTWKLMRTRLKYFPVAYNTQVGVWAALELRKQVDIAQLERITLRVCWFLKLESGSEAEKWDPRTRETADHSLPYIFARALQDGSIDMSTFDLDKIRDPGIRAIMNRVAVEEDAEIEAEWPGVIQAKLDAVDRGGKTYHIHIRNPRGHELNPLSPADIEAKFLRLTEPALGRERAAAAFKTAWRTKEAASFASVLEKFELTR
jgi:2-methylcitrate dehydratase